MKIDVVVSLCLLGYFFKDVGSAQVRQNKIGARKLFGGYRITPRYCKPSRPPAEPLGGPNICMFNHECRQKNGLVVGACMDGFLFGACCQLPPGVSVGEFVEEESVSPYIVENGISTRRPITTPLDITSLGVSQIAESLLNPGVLPTAMDNEVVQVSSNQHFSTAGVTHPEAPDTLLVNQLENEIDPGYFMPTSQPVDEKRTTLKNDEYQNTPIIAISISNAPLEYTTVSGFSKPIFRPKPIKPNDNNYVRIPTINHNAPKPNKTQEYDSIVNILQVINGNATRRPTLATRIPPTEVVITSRKPPSTSYVFSTTLPPRRTQPTKKKSTTKSTKVPNSSFFTSTKTTYAYSPTAFVTSIKPPSTSYVYSSTPPRRPPASSTMTSHIVGPTFSVSSRPVSSTFSTPAPTIIVLGPVTDEIGTEYTKPSTYQQQQYPVTLQRPTALPQRKPATGKPVHHVTINQHVTQNYYSTTERPLLNSYGSSERPSPTILITPKPSSSFRPQDYSDIIEVGTIPSAPDDDNINFPPVRNPNLNMSNIHTLNENDITTPVFIEDEALNANVESFVNKIIEGLQEPFHGLKDVVYNRRNSTILSVGTTTKSTTKKPLKQGNVTKKPVITTLRPAATTLRPVNTRITTTSRPGTTTRRPGNRKTTQIVTTKKPVTTIKKTKPTKKPLTTTPTFIEHSTDNVVIDSEDYRTQCGIRPLVRAAKIVGGKGAQFGEFPWQVLVRESTWLGLFTKNKCGGVLISHKYVMTAAHCQPGFLASLVAVFGEFDISGDLEKKRPISRNVKRVIVHRQYDAQTFENDLALLELEQPVQFDQHILPICLPRDNEDFVGRMATVTGWGRLKYGGGVPSVLQEVQVPIMENPVCQEMFRTAGHSKVILDSFLCAGYANGQKDSCEGDSGGPLVLQRPDGRYQLAGTVSHGIKCAAPYLPGVYMRTQFFKPWITSITGVTAP
ncbi:serine protease filzig [Diabrotica virgifera virgifera]|uniref:Serine protease lint n=1 Tax=Diabrotica virgifera virgifera TaxID=50390 RepID=A0A6P7GBR6_DIAVI|nr:serine protease filzig [Diabrotica virgifera virgifera]